ncbi:hypothetical protein L2D08_07375 [Domibacillus sp. PGB-M46]|uniref:hypothetical protein n=1 Tax=Domibacillus sp. PGB-M46 TaxID=2910255 RepID=UPI001F55C7D6|nr:hypothetical protein [Domibacillus sp. PGB-M46]MCI2254182.1 hypothetical protein [Domibacillus sp. PGB-M46]
MKVEVKYRRFDMKEGRLVPSLNYSYEIVEIDNQSIGDSAELAGDALSRKLYLSKDRFEVIESRPV